MAVIVECPSCDAQLKASDDKRGKKIRCPKCQEIVQIPAATPAKKSRADDDGREFSEKPLTSRRSRQDEDEDARPSRSARRRDERDDDYDDDERRRRPRREKRSVLPWVLAGSAAAVLAIGGAVATLYLLLRKPVPEQQANAPPKAAAAAIPGPGDAKPAVANAGAAPFPADLKDARLVPVVAADVNWKISMAPTPAPGKTIPVGLPARTDFFEGVKGFVVNAACRRAVVGYHLNKNNNSHARMVVCDLENGKLVSQFNVPGSMVPVSLSDDGQQLLLRREDWGFGNQDRLELWSVSATGGEKMLEMVPYDDVKGGGRSLRLAALLDGKRLLTASDSGKLVLWDVAARKPLYQMHIQGGTVPGLSPDRKLLAFTTGKDLGILDIDAGKVLALEPTPNGTPFASLSFSPGGKWLACAAFDRVFVWNLSNGELFRELRPTGVHINGHVAWPSEQHLLIGGGALVDLESQVHFWDYQGHDRSQSIGDTTWFVAHDGPGGQGAIIPAVIPHPAALKACKQAIDDIVLQKGTTVNVDVSGLPDAAEAKKVAAALEAQLEKNGCKAGPDGTVDLVATADVGKEIEMAFTKSEGQKRKGFMPPPLLGPKGKAPAPKGPVRVAKMREHFARLKFVSKGKTVWEASGSNLPKSVLLEEGETLEQHLKKLEHPDYKFYQTVELPRLLMRSSGTAAIGSSKVGVAGVR